MSTSNIFIGLLQWFAGNCFVILLSLVLWSYVRIHRPHIDFALLLFYYLLSTTFFVLIMGLLGLLEPNIMAAVSFPAAIMLLSLYRKPIVSSVWEIRSILTDIWRACVGHPFMTAGFAMAFLLVGLRMLAHIWILSPYIWDTLSYQLPKIADWIQYEKLVALPTPVTRSFWPANFELFQTWFVVFFHHDFIIEAAGLPFYLLALISLYSISRSLFFTRYWSAAIVVIFSLTPAVLMNAVSCKNDISVVSIYLFILAMLLNYRKNRDLIVEHLVLIIAAFFLALGTKATMAFILPGLGLIGIWCFWGWRADSVGREGQRNILIAAGFILTVSLFLGSYWYVRNYVMFDNPFYPTDFRIFGQLVFGDGRGGQLQQGSFNWNSILLNFKDLIQNKILDRTEPYTADLLGMTGWGWFVFSCGLPASLLALFIRFEFRWLTAGFLLSLACLFGFVTPDPWNMRFATWFPVIFIIGYAAVTNHIKINLIRRSLISLAIICSLLNFIACISTGYTQPKEWRDRASVPVWKRTLITDELINAMDKYPLWSSCGEKVNYFTHGNAMIYQLYGPDYSRKLQYIPLRKDIDITCQLKRKNANCIVLFETKRKWIELFWQNVEQGKIKHVSDIIYCISEPTKCEE